MRYLSNITTIALALALAVGCSEISDVGTTPIESSSQEVSFTTNSSLTRVDSDGDEWEQDDEVGITMWYGGCIYEKYRNIKHTVDIEVSSGTTTLLSEGDAMLFPRDTSVNFVAYYPYSADLVADDYKGLYTLDLTSQEDLGAIDFLFSESSWYNEDSTEDVELSFDHMLSRLEIYVIHSLEDISTLEGMSLTISDVVTKATYSIEHVGIDKKVTDCEKGEIDFNVTVGENKTTAALVALLHPSLFYFGTYNELVEMIYRENMNDNEAYMKIENATLTFTIPNGEKEELVYTTDSFSLNPQMGKVHRYYVVLGNDIIDFVGENEIVDWTSGGDSVALDEFNNEL